MTTPSTSAQGPDLRREEQLRIQAVGAAISRREWWEVEQAYNAIRDEFDRRPASPSSAASPASPSGVREAAALKAARNAYAACMSLGLPADPVVEIINAFRASLASAATSAPTSGSEDEPVAQWQWADSGHAAWFDGEPPFGTKAHEVTRRTIYLAKPASEPAGGGVEEAEIVRALREIEQELCGVWHNKAWSLYSAAQNQARVDRESALHREVRRLKTALGNVRHAIMEGAKGEDAVVTCTLWMPGEMNAETVIDHIDAALSSSRPLPAPRGGGGDSG